MSLLPPLVTQEELRAALGDKRARRIRLFDATVFLRREVPGGPYQVVSGRQEYAAGHIPGAAFADIPGELSDPASPFSFTVPSAGHFAAAIGRLGVGDDTYVVAYAQDSPMWATRLWWLLRYFGHDDTSVLDGGLLAWTAAGGPVEAGEITYPAAVFTARPRAELLARRADVEQIIAADSSTGDSSTGGTSTCLVNALTPDAFRGEGPGAYSRPGRIPGSVNVPWNGLVDPATHRFRPPADLAAALHAGGIRDDQPVVAYCGGGISATVDLFALWLTGRGDAKLYDGSLTEWSADPDLPLVTG
jgi:thiosulfate/3-mercaptopyruvate sulfurtransferase